MWYKYRKHQNTLDVTFVPELFIPDKTLSCTGTHTCSPYYMHVCTVHTYVCVQVYTVRTCIRKIKIHPYTIVQVTTQIYLNTWSTHYNVRMHVS